MILPLTVLVGGGSGYRSLCLQRDGVSPVSRLNIVVRNAWLQKPHSLAISLRGMSSFRSRRFASFMRWSTISLPMECPTAARNRRSRVLRAILNLSAISAAPKQVDRFLWMSTRMSRMKGSLCASVSVELRDTTPRGGTSLTNSRSCLAKPLINAI